jgi:hypothetical protein
MCVSRFPRYLTDLSTNCVDSRRAVIWTHVRLLQTQQISPDLQAVLFLIYLRLIR